MIFKKLKYCSLLLAIVLNSCSAQNTEANKVLVFKVEHTDSKYVGYSSTAYSLLNLKKIKDFKLTDKDSVDSPNITYNITLNGGLFISESFTDIYTLGCCEYNNVEESVRKNFDGETPKNKLDEYSLVNELSINKFQDELGVNFLFKEGTATYEITVWLAQLDYCQCDIYMETPKQEIYENQAAYIKEIKSVSKPNQETKKEIEIILKKLIELDVKH